MMRNKQLKGQILFQAPPESQSSYHSELGGLYGLVFFITTMLEYFLHEDAYLCKGGVSIGCDGESALKYCFEQHKTLKVSDADFDLIIAICKRMYQFPNFQWHYQHIPGHQDKHIAYEKLDIWGQTNIDMDGSTKAYWRKVYHSQGPIPPRHDIYMSPWSIVIDEVPVRYKLKETLQENIARDQDLKAYWESKSRFGT